MTTREEEVSALAVALRDAARSQLITAVEDVPIDATEYERFLVSLTHESDRALPIVAFAYLDEKLKELMAQVLNPGLPGGVQSLFEVQGPLSTSSARIRMAAALFWLSKRTHRNLDQLRKIRNEFAHRPFTHGFDASPICDHVDAMEPVEARLLPRLKEKYGRDLTSLDRRRLLHLRIILTAHSLATELITAPLAIRHSLAPDELAALPHEELPKPLKELGEAIASALLTVFERDAAPKAGA